MWLPALLALVSFLLSFLTILFHNDHFGRISPGRQIALYGDLPFRDYLDPGYLLTEFSSAAMLRIFGDNLLGEALLTSGAIAGGIVVVFLLARRVSGSSITALVAALLALLMFPRAYDYDKVLFYPLGLLLLWRAIESRGAGRIWALAGGLVVGALYRYDTAIYLGAAAVVGLGLEPAGTPLTRARRIGLLAGAAICLALPALVWLQLTSGLTAAADQMLTYGRREAARTWLSAAPAVSVTALAALARLPPPPRTIRIRWAPNVDDAERLRAEARHGLLDGQIRDDPAERTRQYQLSDTSTAALHEILTDPDVEDTLGIDRQHTRMTPEPLWIRAQRTLPFLRVRLLPDAWTLPNATAFLYWLFRMVPLIASGVLLVRPRSDSQGETAQIASLVTCCLLLNVFVLRDPVNARIGAISGPMAVLMAWLVRQAWRLQRPLARRAVMTAAAATVVLVVAAVSLAGEWGRQLGTDLLRPSYLVRQVEGLRAAPRDSSFFAASGLVKYLRACTSTRDRVLVMWFGPEVYFYAQRGFAAGLTEVFGEHWSEPRFQEQSLRKWRSESVPVVLMQTGDESVDQNYPMLVRYLNEQYQVAGKTSFGDSRIPGDAYTVLVRRDRTPRFVHAETSLPCF